MAGTNGNGQGVAGREGGVLVIGGGMAGISAAIEAAEAGSDVYVVEQGPSLGGRVAQLHQYFPKLCPPYCGLEINFRRIRSDHRHFKVFTLASLERVSGSVGDYEATIRLDPRYVVLDRCIACNRCAEVCPIDAIDLQMQPKTVTVKVGSIVLATGWKPYDANRLSILGFAEHRDV